MGNNIPNNLFQSITSSGNQDNVSKLNQNQKEEHQSLQQTVGGNLVTPIVDAQKSGQKVLTNHEASKNVYVKERKAK